MKTLVSIEGLSVAAAGKTLVKDLALEIPAGACHVLMGPNGAGKSSLAAALMGNPEYEVSGSVLLNGAGILALDPAARARAGLFLAFQQPPDLPGVSVVSFLRAIDAAAAKSGNRDCLGAVEMTKRLRSLASAFGLPESMLKRGVNEGFSGGERKRLEMLQMCFLEPRLAVLDEPDSGLDIDAIELVVTALAALRSPDRSSLVISHSPALVRRLSPDAVHVLRDGCIVASGGLDLVSRIEEGGYAEFVR